MRLNYNLQSTAAEFSRNQEHFRRLLVPETVL